MKKIFQNLIVIVVVLYSSNHSFAEKYIGDKSVNTNVHPKAEQCQPATGSTELDLNNVRARIKKGLKFLFLHKLLNKQEKLPKFRNFPEIILKFEIFVEFKHF